MRLSEIKHQGRAISILRRSLDSGRTHHAYLFAGPDGVGKEATAHALAARLLCSGEKADPNQGALFGAEPEVDPIDACGHCESCHLFSSNNHPDFQLIHRGLRKLHPDRTVRASKGLFLVVELIRHFLIEPASLKPSIGDNRVFIIREAERMNEAAQNALLKTLEEPPGNATLILVTSSAQRLLPTIRSRCQTIPFGLLPPSFVADQLAAMTDFDPTTAQTLASLSGGRLGEAIRWGKIDLLKTAGEVFPLLVQRQSADPEGFAKSLVASAEDLGRRILTVGGDDDEEEDKPKSKSSKTVPTDTLRDAMKLTLMLVGAAYRDAMMLHVQADPHLQHLKSDAAVISQLANIAPPTRCERAIEAVTKAELMLDRNVAAQLVGERLSAAIDGI